MQKNLKSLKGQMKKKSQDFDRNIQKVKSKLGNNKN